MIEREGRRRILSLALRRQVAPILALLLQGLEVRPVQYPITQACVSVPQATEQPPPALCLSSPLGSLASPHLMLWA
jgi:hypothetical protein